MNKISMMFQIVSLLQTNYILNATELAEILETTPRIIKAYIEALRMSGVPIEGMTGRNGGYFLSEVYEFKPPKLSESEYNALLLAEEILTKENGFHHEKEIKTAFAKIKSAQGEIIGNSDLVFESENVFTRGNTDISDKIKDTFQLLGKPFLQTKAFQSRIQILPENS